MDISSILLLILTGLAYGMLLFIFASGMSIIFGLMNVVNLTHGTFFALGAYIAYSFMSRHYGFWTALVLSVIVIAAIGLVIERLMLAFVYGSHDREVLVTFGLMFIAADVMKGIWGADSLTLGAPSALNSTINMGEVMFPAYRLFVIFVGIILAFILWFMENHTKTGAIIRAGVDDRVMLSALGINVKVVFAGVFVFGAVLAGAAGVLGGPILSIYSGMDAEVLIISLVIVVIGGLGTWKGTFIAALLVGMINTFGQMYFPSISMALVFLFMIVVLLVKPTGLFGKEVGA
ncbi:branched-chain amino acid ABC transporter permease [Ferviditalea candida]|uniref:Branched-chain amino acid ABC transporter permease n=1 Tax=Ferviditalea candida TaxID=3108399 RepID=A0ABU5ZDI4_9BACL|nr:branched-chain amino acid ABC transporter permease [Paenibacillaceae bacterium T2]